MVPLAMHPSIQPNPTQLLITNPQGIQHPPHDLPLSYTSPQSTSPQDDKSTR
ncbi:neurogenic locus Notch protein-like [Sesbania bispinosa]|nr:neurogenic locus Notch protein-like [Sesbania bispinosa]